LLEHLLISIIAACGVIGIISFVLYARARMKEDEPREKYYLRIHYTALFIVLILGMVFLFYMVNTAD
jgi:hypothetical protein